MLMYLGDFFGLESLVLKVVNESVSLLNASKNKIDANILLIDGNMAELRKKGIVLMSNGKFFITFFSNLSNNIYKQKHLNKLNLQSISSEVKWALYGFCTKIYHRNRR